MKEATSELNLTIIVVISIAGLAAFFYMTLWPMMQENMNRYTKCSVAICGNEKRTDSKGYAVVDCKYKGTDLVCPWKG